MARHVHTQSKQLPPLLHSSVITIIPSYAKLYPHFCLLLLKLTSSPAIRGLTLPLIKSSGAALFDLYSKYKLG